MCETMKASLNVTSGRLYAVSADLSLAAVPVSC